MDAECYVHLVCGLMLIGRFAVLATILHRLPSVFLKNSSGGQILEICISLTRGGALAVDFSSIYYNGPAIVCASPQHKLYRLQRKGEPNILLFMPLCSLAELQDMQSKLTAFKVEQPAKVFWKCLRRHDCAFCVYPVLAESCCILMSKDAIEV